MKKEQIHIEDIKRILLGQAPPIFLLEVLIRTVIVFIFLLFVVRWLGKRMSGQLTITEMSIMLTLGAIVSVGFQVPDRGIILSMFVLICTVLFHRWVSKWGYKNAHVEELTQGKLSLLVKDGILQIEEMTKCRISHQQLYAQLRSTGIYNLGKVKRIYLEASGLFSVFTTDQNKPGLSVMPEHEMHIDDAQESTDMVACGNCGFVKERISGSSKCNVCGFEQWREAVI